MKKKLYFKVYQDREDTDIYYIETFDNVMKMCKDIDYIIDSELSPVFEPVYMTEEEFENLPEFEGF
jgi:hypothetical protein